ncbi:MAG: 30S ribosome-binding factor RbfA [Terrimicrobiaceae bacterium]
MSHRLRRVSEIVLRELGLLVHREITFPVPLVTISAVDLTPDLKNAHVFVSAMGTPEQQTNVLDILEAHRVRLQSELSRRVIIKNTPHLHFRLDSSIERGTRVLGILDELGLETKPNLSDSPSED